MKIFNQLNGWQRLFVLICIVSFVFAFTRIYLFEIEKDEINILSFLPELPNRACIESTKDECDEVIELIRGEKLKLFILANGQRLNLDDRFTSSQVQKAYEQAKDMRNDALISAFKKMLVFLLASWIGIYFFGWMIGWIWRGFSIGK